MDDSTSAVWPPQVTLQPLQRRNKHGDPYRRPAVIEAQIAAVLPLPADELLARAADQQPNQPGFLHEETLVYMIRAHHLAANDELVNGLVAVLCDRCQRQVNVQYPHLDESDQEQIHQDAFGDLLKSILHPDPTKGEYLQIRFWHAHKRRVIDAYRRERAWQRRLAPDPAGPREGADGPETQDDEPDEDTCYGAASGIGPEDWALVRDALRSLDPRQAEAYWLRRSYDWPVESDDPAVPTLSRRFGVTPRTIRNWIDQAEEALERWRGESHDE